MLGNVFVNPWLAKTYEIEYSMYVGSTFTVFGCLCLVLAYMIDEYGKRTANSYQFHLTRIIETPNVDIRSITTIVDEKPNLISLIG